MNNFTNNRWITVVVLLLITANIVTLALLWTNKTSKQQQMAPPPRGGGGQVFEFLTQELNLDKEQREKYKLLRDEHQAGIRPLQDSIRRAKDVFFALIKKENISDAEIEALSKRNGELEQRKDVITFLHFQKLRKLCNAEQQQKFDNVIQDAIRSMAGPKKRYGPPPDMEEGDRRPPPPHK